jgi:hypothetical protein
MLVPGWRNFILTGAELAEARVEINTAKTSSGKGPLGITLQPPKLQPPK